VGTIDTSVCARSPRAVHPHGRGDNAGLAACRCFALRFTPTGVGTIASRPAGTPSTSVHPHGRGDNQSLTRASSRISGSPPRAWGQ